MVSNGIVVVVDGKPWHFVEVPLEGSLVTVAAAENNLDILAICVGLIVVLLKLISEFATWGCPMAAKVDTDVLVVGKSLDGVH